LSPSRRTEDGAAVEIRAPPGPRLSSARAAGGRGRARRAAGGRSLPPLLTAREGSGGVGEARGRGGRPAAAAPPRPPVRPAAAGARRRVAQGSRRRWSRRERRGARLRPLHPMAPPCARCRGSGPAHSPFGGSLAAMEGREEREGGAQELGGHGMGEEERGGGTRGRERWEEGERVTRRGGKKRNEKSNMWAHYQVIGIEDEI